MGHKPRKEKNMFKKIITMGLIIAGLAMLAACSSTDSVDVALINVKAILIQSGANLDGSSTDIINTEIKALIRAGVLPSTRTDAVAALDVYVAAGSLTAAQETAFLALYDAALATISTLKKGIK